MKHPFNSLPPTPTPASYHRDLARAHQLMSTVFCTSPLASLGSLIPHEEAPRPTADGRRLCRGSDRICANVKICFGDLLIQTSAVRIISGCIVQLSTTPIQY